MRPKYSTTEGIRAAHAFGLVEEGFHTEAEANAAFDRWLRAVKAEAWREGFMYSYLTDRACSHEETMRLIADGETHEDESKLNPYQEENGPTECEDDE